ncbi:1-acyl-sn-glycerol-3-phosphate acyltransferase [Fulvivirga maritima]|uniref:lysophospholipid acyltransferase family protein n=1 Tax=Fulvivirga maritima TaxID=2904247 RepID=UPI001F4093ED|nr:lysophospholipid acyltransferase family protein [Fulvivirga maritima]UII24498.1 1-acyl-sn-glycerol-3-phosphate acyltransferase [Fulvivirga maritima]
MAKTIFLFLFRIWVLLIFTVFMIILLPLIIFPIMLGAKYGNATFFGLRLWSLIFSFFTFIRYSIIDKHKINKKKSYIYTCNHTSFLDLPGLVQGITRQFRPLAKKELLKIPIFGIIVKLVTVIVDRSSVESRKASIMELKQTLKDGISILIFPEGTQNRTTLPLQPFYDGAFRIAIETGACIMPTVILNAGKLMPPSSLNLKPGRVKVIFGDEIDASEYELKELPFLKERVFNAMMAIIEKHEEKK